MTPISTAWNRSERLPPPPPERPFSARTAAQTRPTTTATIAAIASIAWIACAPACIVSRGYAFSRAVRASGLPPPVVVAPDKPVDGDPARNVAEDRDVGNERQDEGQPQHRQDDEQVGIRRRVVRRDLIPHRVE